jgi:preprotein translocase SecE subunit
MSKATEMVRQVGVFFGEVGTEFRKTTWPERRELVESSLVVVSFIVLLSAVVLVCDKAIQFVLTQIRA